MPVGLFLAVPLTLGKGPCWPTFLQEPQTPAGRFGLSLLWGHCSFPLVWARFCLCPPRPKSLFLSPMEVLSSNPASLQGQILGIPQSFVDPQVGSSSVGFRTLLRTLESFFGIIVLQFVGHPPGRYGISFHSDCALLPSCVASSLSLDVGYLFLGSIIFLSRVVQKLVAALVLLQQEMSSCPTLPT